MKKHFCKHLHSSLISTSISILRCLWCHAFGAYDVTVFFNPIKVCSILEDLDWNFFASKSVNEASKGRLQSKPQRWYSPKTTNKLLSFFQRCLDATVIRYQFDKHFTCVSYSCNKINWCISKRLLCSMHTMDGTAPRQSPKRQST